MADEPDLDQIGEDEPEGDEGSGGEELNFDLIDEATENLVLTNPERGLEVIRQRFNQNDKQRNKLLSNAMRKLKGTEKEKQQFETYLQQLNQRLQRLKETEPGEYERFVAKLSGESPSSAPQKSTPKVETVSDLMQAVRSEIQQAIKSAKDELAGVYQGDKIQSQVDSWLERRPAKLKKQRDRMIELMQANEGMSPESAAAAADPVAFASVVAEASRRKDLPGGDTGLDESHTPVRKKFTNLHEAMRDAKRKVGGIR